MLRSEAKLIGEFERIAQAVAAAELVFYLREDLSDLVLDRVGAFGSLLETLQVRKKILVDKLDQIVSGKRGIMVE